ncbi:MAG: PorT family protein [Bacteroidales bacterium]|nr:PorT family protein [Bacteroidales bacterium]
MKRIIIICCIFLPAILSAQINKPPRLPGYDNKLLHFGFTVGVSTQDYSFERNKVDSVNLYVDSSNPISNFGLQVTIVSDLRLNKYLTLRFLPGLALGQGNISFQDWDTQEKTQEQGFELAALQFPLQLKIRSLRLNNFRPYLLCGLNFMYDMTGTKQGDSDIFVELKRSNINLELGYGIDLYLQYFKFAPEIKLGVGLTDLLDRDKGMPDYVNSIDRISTYYVMLNFHFE